MIVISAQAFPPATGGIQNLLAGTAEYLARAGYEVLVLADGGAEARRFDASAGANYAVRRFNGPRPLRRWLKARALLRLARRGAIEALYLDTWKSLEPLPANLPFPMVPWAHGNEFPPSGVKIARIRRALEKASHILINSVETRNRIGAAMPEGVPFSIVHPPVFPAIEPREADMARAAEVWEGAAGPRLFSICRLIDWKGIDQAIRAMPAIGAAHPGVRFAIAGDGDDRARLEALAAELGLGDRVVFLGRVGDGLKTAMLRSADLFLQPGRKVVEEREGFGITYMEAALQGLPTICGDAGGAPEAIVDGKTGLVVDGASVPAVAEAALRILGDAALHAAMRKAAKLHGESGLWENQIHRILATAGLLAR